MVEAGTNCQRGTCNNESSSSRVSSLAATGRICPSIWHTQLSQSDTHNFLNLTNATFSIWHTQISSNGKRWRCYLADKCLLLVATSAPGPREPRPPEQGTITPLYAKALFTICSNIYHLWSCDVQIITGNIKQCDFLGMNSPEWSGATKPCCHGATESLSRLHVRYGVTKNISTEVSLKGSKRISDFNKVYGVFFAHFTWPVWEKAEWKSMIMDKWSGRNWIEDPLNFVEIGNNFGSFQTNIKAGAWYHAGGFYCFFRYIFLVLKHPNVHWLDKTNHPVTLLSPQF